MLILLCHNCRGGIFLNSEFDFFFFLWSSLTNFASISPKASVENSSAQWAIFFFKDTHFFRIFCIFMQFKLLFLLILWNGPGKYPRNNTSIKSGLNGMKLLRLGSQVCGVLSRVIELGVECFITSPSLLILALAPWTLYHYKCVVWLEHTSPVQVESKNMYPSYTPNISYM